MYLGKSIKKFCESKNLIYAIVNVDRLDFDENILEDTPFVNYSVDERLEPKLSMENAKSVLIIGLPYYKNEINHYDVDYHINMTQLLTQLSEEIVDKLEVQSKAFVDTGALFERGFALKAGLGFKAKNTCVINDKLGSYFNIGYILLDVKLEPTNALDKQCIGCDLCIKNCPTNSLREVNGIYKCNSETCISYLTQKKGVLTDYEVKKMGTSIYGCEVCQKVCPHNKDIGFSETATYISPIEVLEVSKKSFQKHYNMPFYWRGIQTIKRNALISICNSNIDKSEKIQIISKFKDASSEVLKETALQLLKILEV